MNYEFRDKNTYILTDILLFRVKSGFCTFDYNFSK